MSEAFFNFWFPSAHGWALKRLLARKDRLANKLFEAHVKVAKLEAELALVKSAVEA